ncbi:MAG: hypothetical protein MZV63_58780 [Marinilabiliales bacterium]|nr:hypothetical protein [Marinilabiliales bacterium]
MVEGIHGHPDRHRQAEKRSRGARPDRPGRARRGQPAFVQPGRPRGPALAPEEDRGRRIVLPPGRRRQPVRTPRMRRENGHGRLPHRHRPQRRHVRRRGRRAGGARGRAPDRRREGPARKGPRGRVVHGRGRESRRRFPGQPGLPGPARRERGPHRKDLVRHALRGGPEEDGIHGREHPRRPQGPARSRRLSRAPHRAGARARGRGRPDRHRRKDLRKALPAVRLRRRVGSRRDDASRAPPRRLPRAGRLRSQGHAARRDEALRQHADRRPGRASPRFLQRHPRAGGFHLGFPQRHARRPGGDREGGLRAGRGHRFDAGSDVRVARRRRDDPRRRRAAPAGPSGRGVPEPRLRIDADHERRRPRRPDPRRAPAIPG